MSLLGPGDPPPFTLHNAGGEAPVLVVCDHAANDVPAALGDLGLSPGDRAEHIAWDIGARDIAVQVAERLDAAAVLAGYSRLVIDCNRYPHDAAAALARSDGIDVPANRELGAADLARRVAAIHEPYHAAIAARLQAMPAATALISVHSMTAHPRLGQPRPWEMCLCWARDERLARPLLDRLRAAGIVTGDNEPYRLDIGEDYTVPEHAMRRGLAHVQVEFRQDLVASAAGARRWAARFVDALGPLLDDSDALAPQRYWPDPVPPA